MTSAKHNPSPVLVHGLSKSFGQGESRVNALTNVSLEVIRGEHVAVIGPSGSGKSTLLHLIAGLTTPDTGSVTIGGNDLADMNDRRLTLFRRQHIGMVFQAYNLIPTLTVEDNLKLPLLLDRKGESGNDQVDAMLKSLGLEGRRKHRPDQLSGGEQQRVAVGRAMITNPTVILADEPTGNLDTANSRKLCELMHGLCTENGCTMVTVTHDPAVAIWASKVMILKDGYVAETLNTSEFTWPSELGARFLEVIGRQEEAGTCA